MTIEQILYALENMGGLVPYLGIQIHLQEEAIRCEMKIEQHHCGAPGVSHGGAVMSLLDTALGAHALKEAIRRHQATSTVELKVNFLRPAKQGHTLVTSTTMQSAGKSLLVISGVAKDQETGEQVGFAVGTFNLYTPRSEGIEAFQSSNK